ncbi:DUF3775 domain-containing protein [Rhizobium sp. P40RR-XXII]|uniref:DUF3775 domain-containing protein n=1 Tax=Rhizobium sp. P40RR-XXII TaxID=2726739 RepID=UPI0014569E0B|nr:DUF3775 domain-containing protein [Rhizobium sp. P40RR-XXII]
MAMTKKLDKDRPAWPLTISPEKVCFFILKARQFDAKDAPTNEGSASNPSDDAMIDVLEDRADDPVQEEIRSAIWALSVDEQIDLVTLVWLGRGDGIASDWRDIREAAAEAHNNRTAAYLLGTPLLGDYLEEALSMFDESCQAMEANHL